MRQQKFIDVLVRTKDSERYLSLCLEAINREIPVGKIIIVDAGSSDKTLEIASSFPNVSLFVKPELNLGQAITFGFSQAATEWVAIIDSDFILRKGWWEDKKQYMEWADAIEGCEITHFSFEIPMDCARINYGRFGNTLLKRVSMFELDLDMHFGEDVAVSYFFRKKGLKWTKTGTLLADHYPKVENLVHSRTGTRYVPLLPIYIPKEIQIEDGHIARKYGTITPKQVIKRMLFNPVHDAYTTLKKNFWFCMAYFKVV